MCADNGASENSYRHTRGAARLIVQNRFTGDLIWSCETAAPQPCTNPVQSGGMVVFGNVMSLVALRVGDGARVDSPWHGVDCTGYVPAAIAWQRDEDGDGLPDTWELKHLGNLAGTAGEDPDTDTADNEAEYVAGTAPRDKASCLSIHAERHGEQTRLSFDALPADGPEYDGRRLYALDSAATLRTNQWQPLPGCGRISGTGRVEILAPAPSSNAVFYRLRVWLD